MCAATAKTRIICVDDEPHVVAAISDNLYRECEVLGANNGADALALLQREPNVEVIVSDMRMPGMDGATLLARARELRPDVPRILLTGQADITSAIAAVNNGQLFRFLTKPCAKPQLQAAIAAAVEHHRLITAERVLLERTLHGSVAALVDILALTNPAVFGRATRVKGRVVELANILGVEPRWQVEMAALLQTIGYVTLPPETIDKLHAGVPLSDDDKRMTARLPSVADQLLGHIPRLEDVRAIIIGAAKPTIRIDTIVDLGAAVLRVAGDLDDLVARRVTLPDALAILRARTGSYGERVLDAVAKLASGGGPRVEVREVTRAGLRVGMVFAEDVKMASGALLVSRGYEVTFSLIERVRNFAPGAVREPLRVTVPL